MLQKAILCKASYNDADPRFTTVGDLRFGLIGSTLVFRGTANWRNVMRDLFVVPLRSRSGYLSHGGVARAEHVLWDHVIAKLYGASLNNVHVTGHSFGGGLALNFARALRLPVTTFGCLRNDYRFGAPPPTIEHTRIVCDDDPVTMVPRILYKHTCDAVVLHDRDGGIDVKDHGIDVYIRRLAACGG